MYCIVGICPLGHYCPEATADPIECQPGEYNNRTGSESDADCLPCIPGWYCPGMQTEACRPCTNIIEFGA